MDNVLFIIVDSMRADALGVNGNRICRTPNLDALAADGASFSNCFAQNPTCAPSRAAILTGCYPHVRGHRTFTYHIRPDEEYLFKYFKRAGYTVKAVGTNDCLHESCFEECLDEWLECEGSCMDGLKGPLSADPVKSKAFLSGKLSADQAHDRNWHIKERTVEFLKGTPRDPWFFYSALHVPHPKYGVPDPWYSMYDPACMPDPIHCDTYDDKHAYMKAWHELSNMDKLTAADVKLIRAIYYGMVSLTDQYVGEMIAALKASDRYDDTTIIVMSDHGDYTGDYGLVEKGHTVSQDCILNVPLIIKPAASANMDAGHVRPQLCETIDVLPTLLELNGIPLSCNQNGRSLLPLLRGQTDSHRDAVFFEGGYGRDEYFALDGVRMKGRSFLTNPTSVYGPRCRYEAEHPEIVDRFAAVRTDQWKFVYRGGGPHELYDLTRDSGETENVSGREEYRETLLEMKERLLEWYLYTSDCVPFTIDDRLCTAAWDPVRGLRR